jgi:hypothetical protein
MVAWLGSRPGGANANGWPGFWSPFSVLSS